MGAFLELTRPSVWLLSVLGLIVGMRFIAVPINQWILPIITVFAICASGSVINDFFDRSIDSINKPKRPLASGKVTPQESLWLYLALVSVGLVAAFFVSINFFWLAAINAYLLYVYSWKIKKNWMGNLLDTYLAISVFLAPVLISGGFLDILSSPLIYLAPIPFFVNYGREILKAVEDIKGDKKAKARTLPVILGEKRAILFGKLMVFVGALCLFIPYYFRVFGASGEYYFMFALAVFASSIFILGMRNITKVQKLVKVLMFLVLFAFFWFAPA